MVKELTGITDNQIEKFGSPLKSVIDELHELSKKCEFLVGHNAIFFDSKFLDRACTELGLRCLGPNWIDTLIDVNFPTHMRTRKLSHLAAEHKISLFNHHRAVFDVLTMFQILSRYDIQEIADRASSELVQVVAKVSIENKNQASELGFRWNPKDKIWSKLMRQFDIEKAKFPFSVQVVKHEF
ncbi:MAG: 3'-5' exonuclease, partial [Bdellovibrionaceae bacterium]|nr:3'-5' exonuclease [Pseudobdellovibrionaceae bacterium]